MKILLIILAIIAFIYYIKTNRKCNNIEKFDDNIDHEMEKIINNLESYINALSTESTNKNITRYKNSKYINNYKYSDIIKEEDVRTNIPIYIFFHISPIGDYWDDIVNEQIYQLYNSGLYDICTKIFYGGSGPQCKTLLNNKFKYDNKFEPLEEALEENDKTYENKTINALINKSHEIIEDAYILYIHSKGVTNVSSTQHSWRRFMMHWLVNNHEKCRKILDKGYYTVGTLLIPYDEINLNNATKHYSGNFFWADKNYVRKLNLINKTFSNNESEIDLIRCQSEFKLLTQYEPGKHISLPNEHYTSQHGKGLYTFDALINDYKDDELDIFIF